MSSQFDEQKASVENVNEAIDEGFSATVYVKPSQMGPAGKRLASLVIEPDIDMLCRFDPDNIEQQNSVSDAVYPSPFEQDSLSIELSEIESNDVLQDILSCLEEAETDN